MNTMGLCFSAPAPEGVARHAVAGAGAPEVLFFPDEKMPCRVVMRGGKCRRGDACEYAHGPTSLTRVLDVINAAERTLDVCVFTITCNELADAIIAARARGVTVRVISDDDQANARGSDLASIGEAGVEVRTDAASTHMHHKYAVIDGETLLNGSFNWTRQAVLGNQENVMVLRDERLASVFAAEFERTWGQFKANRYRG